jgi:phosphoenolpyruvate-protein phosphotransferase
MPEELNFPFPLPNGLHARPASAFRDAANRFASTMTLTNRYSNTKANAKSALALVATLTKKGDPCSLRIEGSDELGAVKAMQAFIDSDLPHCDDELPKPTAGPGAGSLPRILRTDGTIVFEGIAVSRGIAHARAHIVNAWTDLPDVTHQIKGTVNEELAKVDLSLQRVLDGIHGQLAVSTNKTQQDILRAHLSIAEDIEFHGKVLELIRGGKLSAGEAIVQTTEHFTGILQQSGSAYLRERIVDIRDIARLVLREMYGTGHPDAEDNLDVDGIWIAETLSPARFIALDKQHLKGIVLSQGGTTSHTVILARAFGIPCLTGVKDIQFKLEPGQDIVLDAERGLVVPNPTSQVVEFYQTEIRKIETQHTRLLKFKNIPGATADGKRLEVGANVGSVEEAKAAFQNGAEGIGLFRTELLFMNRTSPPDEEEQYKVYAETAKLAGKRGVIIRTLDIGGDKPVPYMNLAEEANPFLGYRAVRTYEAHKEIVETQLRAILRASAHGNLKVMVPMICSVQEVRSFRTWLNRIMQDLDRDKVKHNKGIELGIMVEIPSVAFIIDQLSREVDFFSIGSNDLTQYFLAVDRDNEHVGHLYSSFHPSFLRLLKKIVDDAHAAKKWVGICGELGANRLALPVFIGCGVDEISLASPDIALMKATLGECSTSDCESLLQSVLQLETPTEVEKELKSYIDRSADGSLIVKEIIRLGSESGTKDEVIRELVNLLHLAGRIDDTDKVEEAVWQREDTYSTGVGFGVAIPHCKSSNVITNSIAVLKLKSPIEWKSLDDRPVELVILIVIKGDRTGDEHLKMIASLSRKLMDDNFRQRLMNASKETKVLDLVKSALTL